MHLLPAMLCRVVHLLRYNIDSSVPNLLCRSALLLPSPDAIIVFRAFVPVQTTAVILDESPAALSRGKACAILHRDYS